MKPSTFALYTMFIFSWLAGCAPAPEITTPGSTGTPAPSQTQFLPTVTRTSTASPTETIQASHTPSPSPSITATLVPPTLAAEPAEELLQSWLRGEQGCPQPCFLGIVPGITTVSEAIDILRHIGLRVENSGQLHVNQLKLDSDLSMAMSMLPSDGIIKNLHLRIYPKKQTDEVEREWLAYSPETLIGQYGTPSRVDFVADWGPATYFSMRLYFDSKDLVVHYSGDNLIPDRRISSQLCPLTLQYEAVWIWIGKDPIRPPGSAVPLEQVTSLTLEEFANLMTGDPQQACFTFRGDLYP